jgi:Domain of unknown function (DUF1707)
MAGLTGHMSTSATSAGPGRPPSSAGRPPTWPAAGLRIGDAERAEVTDRLARHYGDGRLDQDEFNERLDKAMRATTVADLAGLLADLPDGKPLSFLYPLPVQGLGAEPGGRLYQRRLLKLQLEQQRREQHELLRQQRARHGHALVWVVAIAVFVLVGSAAMRVLANWFVACVVLGVIAILLLRRGSGGSGDRRNR